MAGRSRCAKGSDRHYHSHPRLRAAKCSHEQERKRTIHEPLLGPENSLYRTKPPTPTTASVGIQPMTPSNSMPPTPRAVPFTQPTSSPFVRAFSTSLWV